MTVRVTAVMQEVVARFENQGETQRHLEELKSENDREIARLTEERDRLQSDFTEKRYSGEAKLSRLLSELTAEIIGSAKFHNFTVVLSLSTSASIGNTVNVGLRLEGNLVCFTQLGNCH